jgi:hypothetical protein
MGKVHAKTTQKPPSKNSERAFTAKNTQTQSWQYPTREKIGNVWYPIFSSFG